MNADCGDMEFRAHRSGSPNGEAPEGRCPRSLLLFYLCPSVLICGFNTIVPVWLAPHRFTDLLNR